MTDKPLPVQIRVPWFDEDGTYDMWAEWDSGYHFTGRWLKEGSQLLAEVQYPSYTETVGAFWWKREERREGRRALHRWPEDFRFAVSEKE